MTIHPLLRKLKVRHRTMITLVRPLCTRLFRYWTIYGSFEIILEFELSIGLEFNVLRKSIAIKKHSI